MPREPSYRVPGDRPISGDVGDQHLSSETIADETLTHLIDIVQAAAPLAVELREQASAVGRAVPDGSRAELAVLEGKAAQLETVLARAVGLLWRYRTLRLPEPIPLNTGRSRRRDDKLAAALTMPGEPPTPTE